MKRLAIFVGTIIVLTGFQSKRSDFSGAWKIDLKQSLNLPESFRHVDTYSMDVRQTADSMFVAVGLSGSGQNVMFPQTAYAFDSSEIYREDTLRGSRRWSKCVWATTGKKMIVMTRVKQKKGQAGSEYTQKDVWQMNDRNTVQITITQSFIQGDSIRSERRIFHRVM